MGRRQKWFGLLWYVVSWCQQQNLTSMSTFWRWRRQCENTFNCPKTRWHTGNCVLILLLTRLLNMSCVMHLNIKSQTEGDTLNYMQQNTQEMFASCAPPSVCLGSSPPPLSKQHMSISCCVIELLWSNPRLLVRSQMVLSHFSMKLRLCPTFMCSITHPSPETRAYFLGAQVHYLSE